MHKSRVPLLWLIAITLGLLALMMDFISLTGFFLPVVASGVFFIMRLKKVSTVIKPLQLAAPGIPVEAKFKSNDGPSWKGVMGRIVLKAIVIVVIVCLIGYYLLLPLALGLIFGGLELLFTGRTTIFEGFFNR
jgi:hypothetical protein